MSRLIQFMTVGLLCIAGPLLGSCASCTLRGCRNDVTVDVDDEEGSQVANFSVTAIVAGEELTITCEAGAYAYDDVMIGRNLVSLACETEGQFVIRNVIAQNYPIQVHVNQEDTRSYSGPLSMDTTTIDDEDFNGEGCGTCSYASAEIVLM